MMLWQELVITERVNLEINIKRHFGSLPDETDIYDWVERLYHMTQSLRCLEKEIGTF